MELEVPKNTGVFDNQIKMKMSDTLKIAIAPDEGDIVITPMAVDDNYPLKLTDLTVKNTQRYGTVDLESGLYIPKETTGSRYDELEFKVGEVSSKSTSKLQTIRIVIEQ